MILSGGDCMVTLEFHDPSGAVEVKRSHAPRLSTLEGTRIGFVSNGQWQAYRMLPRLKALLEADFAIRARAASSCRPRRAAPFRW
jgi:hypothetical protein